MVGTVSSSSFLMALRETTYCSRVFIELVECVGITVRKMGMLKNNRRNSEEWGFKWTAGQCSV